jgi:hypothetical protein
LTTVDERRTARKVKEAEAVAESLKREAARKAEEEAEQAEWRRLSDSAPGEYREGFIDGYLRAHHDGQEYQCSIRWAELAFGQYLAEGGRALLRKDVAGW